MSKSIGAIDLVYMWVDGDDPAWQEKKRLYTGKVSDQSETNNIGRYINNDELRYSLRSAEKHVPWIRKIFIVTDSQVPDWLDTSHPKIQVVDHKEIMPAQILPCFNSTVIEYFLYRIPGLEDRFLLANDDMFFYADLMPSYFFAEDGFPIIRLKRKFFGRYHHRLKLLMGHDLGQYRRKVVEGAKTVAALTGKYYSGMPHHNIDSYLKSDYKLIVEDVFKERVTASQEHRVRENGDFHRSAFGYYWLATNRAHVKYVGSKDSLRIFTYRNDIKGYLNKYSPKLFCLNDNEKVSEEHRKKVKPFFEDLFPDASPFEKEAN